MHTKEWPLHITDKDSQPSQNGGVLFYIFLHSPTSLFVFYAHKIAIIMDIAAQILIHLNIVHFQLGIYRFFVLLLSRHLVIDNSLQ